MASLSSDYTDTQISTGYSYNMATHTGQRNQQQPQQQELSINSRNNNEQHQQPGIKWYGNQIV